MIHVNGKLIEQHHFGAGELNIKLEPIEGNVDITWNYEHDGELFTMSCIRQYYDDKRCVIKVDYKLGRSTCSNGRTG